MYFYISKYSGHIVKVKVLAAEKERNLKPGAPKNLGASQICICTTLYVILFNLIVKEFCLVSKIFSSKKRRTVFEFVC